MKWALYRVKRFTNLWTFWVSSVSIATASDDRDGKDYNDEGEYDDDDDNELIMTTILKSGGKFSLNSFANYLYMLYSRVYANCIWQFKYQ